jgi:hypothetical protein
MALPTVILKADYLSSLGVYDYNVGVGSLKPSVQPSGYRL